MVKKQTSLKPKAARALKSPAKNAVARASRTAAKASVRETSLTAIFDTETTDLAGNLMRRLDEQPHIFEFCCWLVNEKDEKVEELDFLCRPGGLLSEESTRITGVHNDELAELPPFVDFIPKVRAIFAKAKTIVAHNLAFDTFVVECEFKRKGEEIAWPFERICTVEQTEHFFGYRLTLTALHEHLFGEVFEQAHKASVDVTALTRCFIELRKRGVV